MRMVHLILERGSQTRSIGSNFFRLTRHGGSPCLAKPAEENQDWWTRRKLVDKSINVVDIKGANDGYNIDDIWTQVTRAVQLLETREV